MTEPATRALRDDEEDWEYPVHKAYQHYVVECISLKHGRVDDPYEMDTRFPKAVLLTLTPSDVKRYLLFKAYNDPYPGPDDCPTYHRASSLKKAKQAISHFMPNRNVPWIEGHGGNPTRHISVSNVIKKVEDLETKGKGVPANDKRAYSELEFQKVLEVFRRETDFNHQIKYPTMTLFAYHLIHRLDDTCQFKINAPHGCVEFPFALKTRTRWSKNVKKMKHCPDQILLGSDDSWTCILLWLAIYLEAWLGMHPSSLYLWTEGRDEKKAPLNVKVQYGNRVSKIWALDEFTALKDETGDEADKGLGTHSERKFSADKSKKQGAKVEQTEYRGRWLGDKGQRVVSRVYVQPDEPFTDAFVASLLCNGGPVKYELKEGCEVDDDWLFVVCIPNIRERFQLDNRFCRVMGLCMLWAAFDDATAEYLPAVEVERIRRMYTLARGAPPDGNPVRKVKLSIIAVNEHDVNIVEQATNQQHQQQGNNQNNNPTAAQGGVTNEQIMAFLQQESRERKAFEAQIRTELSSLKPWMRERFEKLTGNQRRFGGTIGQAFARQHPQHQQRNRNHEAAVARQQREANNTNNGPPAAPRVDNGPAAPPAPPVPGALGARQPQPQRNYFNAPAPAALPRPPQATNERVRLGISPYAKLEKNLRNLHEFWEEYMFGIGEYKPAKDWTTDERNGQGRPLRNKYSRRNKIWRLQSYLTGVGYTIEAANQKIIQVYETDKPTPIIMIISNEQKNQTYPFIGNQRFNPRFIVNAS